MKYTSTIKLSILVTLLLLSISVSPAHAAPKTDPWAWCGILCGGGKYQSPEQSESSQMWQTDRAQYDSDSEQEMYESHDCSSVAVTYILDTEYSKDYRVHDVLAAQTFVGEIWASGANVTQLTRTLGHLGFHEQVLQGIDASIAAANAGHPVMVGVDAYHGSTLQWTGSHIIVVTGGDSTTVHTVPSAPLAQDMPRADLAAIYEGTAAVIVGGVQ